MNFDRLRLVADLADAGETEAMLAVTLPERPGTFLDFVNTALETADIDVTEFKYRYSAGREAAVLFGVALAPGSKECTDLIARLVKGGYPAVDISDLELAQVHLRHLVGGHSETNDNSTTSLLNERIFQVEFPERPGALRRFLPGVSPRWLVTLFHYRRTGNRSSGVLLGLNVPLEDADEFAAAVAAIQADGEFTITEVGGREHEVFKLFLQ
jgi:threonine dehydratase